MTELEYVIAGFSDRFASFHDKRIVLHGSRNYAEAIIENFADSFNFVGILSLDPIEGDYFHGVKVLSEADLPVLNIDVIILTERVKYAVAAFSSIRRVCRMNKISIYNMYGLDEFHVHEEAENADNLTLDKAKEICEHYDMIAFEVINTVLFSPQGVSNTLARKIFCELIKYLHEQKKEIRFSLRKSYPAEMQIEELKAFGLLRNETVEIIRREGEDLSFRKLKEDNPGKKILYFGSGLAYEFILPRCYGIDSCRFIEAYNPANLVSRPRKSKETESFNIDLRSKIENEITKKKLISFDIFDTLLLRKTLYPQDVFCLIEHKALLAGYKAEGFAFSRMRVTEEYPYYNINQIYVWLGERFKWSDAEVRIMQELELETEREVLVPRTEVIDLFNYAKKKGKRLVLTSDMYLPESMLRALLEENGIYGYEKILVSCDIKKSKHSGLYEELSRFCDNTGDILHIGDNSMSDGIDCKAFGIKYFLIPSALEIALNRGWAKSIQRASSLMERCLLGLIISKIFREPFQNPNYKEESRRDQLWRFGFCVIAPLMVGHMTWLIQKLKSESFAGVLFFARDGWLSFEVYKGIQEKFCLPQPIYYYANRKAAFLCCMDFPQELDTAIEKGKMMGLEVEEILKNLFQIPETELRTRLVGETALAYIERHMPLLHKNAVKARRSYLQYSERCKIKTGNSYAVVDFISVGTVQRYISKVVHFKMKGFYFGCYNPSALINDGTDYYLRGDNPLLLNRYVELESFFSSPEPSQKCVTEKGEVVFDEERRSSQELQDIKAVWSSAKSFAVEFFDVFYQTGEYISPSLVEEIYATKDYYINPYSLFDEWLGVPLFLNLEGGKSNNESF